MAHLMTIMAIICLTFSPGALSVWLYAGKGVGCIRVAGKPLCEPKLDAIGMPDAIYCDGRSGQVNIKIEFGFEANDADKSPRYNQDFAFSIPNGVDNFVFTNKFCITPKDTGEELVCYKQDQALNPPSVHGGPHSIGSYDANLEASNIFNDQQTGSPVWIQTPDSADTIELAFGFPNPYPAPEDPWAAISSDLFRAYIPS